MWFVCLSAFSSGLLKMLQSCTTSLPEVEHGPTQKRLTPVKLCSLEQTWKHTERHESVLTLKHLYYLLCCVLFLLYCILRLSRTCFLFSVKMFLCRSGWRQKVKLEGRCCMFAQYSSMPFMGCSPVHFQM